MATTSRIPLVDVRCRANGPSATRASIGQEHFALAAEGRAYLETLTPESCAQTIDGRAHLIASRTPLAGQPDIR